MAHISLHAPRAFHFDFAARIQAVVDAFKARVAYRKSFNQISMELNSMTDRDLADIGISRGMIVQVAREGARKA